MSTRNAEPETVSLATLDACERAVRGAEVDYADKKDKDAQFMKQAVASIQSRIRTLKREAAALWKPAFTEMLDQCHSIRVEEVNWHRKEGVRTKKMRCMACGRWEYCCDYALSGVGPFESDMFNADDVSLFVFNWQDFFRDYRAVCSDSFVSGTKKGKLPEQDYGEFTIGATCLRKAQLYYTINTFLVECCYEANLAVQEKITGTSADAGKWFFAVEANATKFVEKLRQAELAIADEKRALPPWGSDASLWRQVDRARDKASGGLEEIRVELLRRRAESMLGGEDEERDESEESEESEDEDEDVPGPRAPRGAQRVRVILDDDDDDPDVEEKQAKPKRKRKPRAAPTRQSRRVQKLAPEFVEGPHEEGVEEDDDDAEEWPLDDKEESEEEEEREPEPPRPGTRAPQPNAFELAQQQRVPDGRLPARRKALYNLGKLQLKLMEEGRDADAAIATNAMFVLQELLARVDALAHTVE